MEEPTARPPPIRFVATGWRLASAQAAFWFAGGTAGVFAVIALVVALAARSSGATPALTILEIGLAIGGGFAVIGGILLLFVRRGRVDADARTLATPWGEVLPFGDVAAIVLRERHGETRSGSGKLYRYSVWSVGAVRRPLDEQLAADLASFGSPADLDPQPLAVPAGALPHLEAFVLEPPADAIVTLVDAASDRRARRLGARVATRLGVPCLAFREEERGGASRGS